MIVQKAWNHQFMTSCRAFAIFLSSYICSERIGSYENYIFLIIQLPRVESQPINYCVCIFIFSIPNKFIIFILLLRNEKCNFRMLKTVLRWNIENTNSALLANKLMTKLHKCTKHTRVVHSLDAWLILISFEQNLLEAEKRISFQFEVKCTQCQRKNDQILCINESHQITVILCQKCTEHSAFRRWKEIVFIINRKNKL